jgi:hypothetical protein
MYLTKVKMGIKHMVFKVQTLTCCDKHVQLNNFGNLEHVMKTFFFIINACWKVTMLTLLLSPIPIIFLGLVVNLKVVIRWSDIHLIWTLCC